jgi:2-phosphosulfolactate phosphatase
MPERCTLEWGRDGARRAAARGDVVVVVDVLSFSTAVAIAVERGARIIPCRKQIDAENLAVGTEIVAAERRGSGGGHYTLSPLSMREVSRGLMIALASPNGATCAEVARQTRAVYSAGLVNAKRTARAIIDRTDADELITVVACGERWDVEGEDGSLRFAIEDYLGAGAVLAALDVAMDAEAAFAAAAFHAMRHRIDETIWDSVSGRELRERGYGDDVIYASKLDSVGVAARFVDGAFVAE